MGLGDLNGFDLTCQNSIKARLTYHKCNSWLHVAILLVR